MWFMIEEWLEINTVWVWGLEEEVNLFRTKASISICFRAAMVEWSLSLSNILLNSYMVI